MSNTSKRFKNNKQKKIGLNVKSGSEIITSALRRSNRRPTPSSVPFNNQALEEEGERMEQQDAEIENGDEQLEPEADEAEEALVDGSSVAGASVAGAPAVQVVSVQDTAPILRDLNGPAIHKFVGEFRHFLAKKGVAYRKVSECILTKHHSSIADMVGAKFPFEPEKVENWKLAGDEELLHFLETCYPAEAGRNQALDLESKLKKISFKNFQPDN